MLAQQPPRSSEKRLIATGVIAHFAKAKHTTETGTNGSTALAIQLTLPLPDLYWQPDLFRDIPVAD